jgi:hypothetical protein
VVVDKKKKLLEALQHVAASLPAGRQISITSSGMATLWNNNDGDSRTHGSIEMMPNILVKEEPCAQS